MAIYSLNLGFISRSEGRSAVGFNAYISGGKAQDERTGIAYDYGCKDDVIVSRVLAPEGAPEWVKTPSLLWNKVEQFEDDSSVQFTKLDDYGKRATGPDGQKFNKLQYGIAKGSFVCLQDDKKSDRVFIAEGVETALSLKDAGIHGEILASMGINNMSNYQGFEKEIILCADNDDHKQNSQTHNMIKGLQEQFILQGKNVSVIKPTQPGEDFNDVLKKQGRQGVQAYVQPYLNPHADKEAQASVVINAGKLEAQKIAEAQKLAQPTKTTPSSSDNASNLNTIAKYIEDKIREIKAYDGTSLAREAKEELRSYLETFQKDKRMLQDFKHHCPELVQDIQRLYQKKQQVHEKIHQKSYGMDM